MNTKSYELPAPLLTLWCAGIELDPHQTNACQPRYGPADVSLDLLRHLVADVGVISYSCVVATLRVLSRHGQIDGCDSSGGEVE